MANVEAGPIFVDHEPDFQLRDHQNGFIFKKHGISEQTFYRKMYGGLGVLEVRKIKQLEEENRKLKQLVEDQQLMMQIHPSNKGVILESNLDNQMGRICE